jgi:transposase InsO family protein
VAVDVFSRFAWLSPLKDKTGKSVEKALSENIKKAKVRKVRSDAGTEFKNKWVERLLDAHDIYHHVALNDDIKANYVERFNRTLKTMIFRYLAKNKTDRYIDVLQKLVESYNKT